MHLRKSWGIDIWILNFGTRRSCVSVPAAFLQEDVPRNSSDMVLCRPQTQSRFYTKEKNLFLLPDTEPQFFGCTACRSVTTATDWTVLFPPSKAGHSVPKIQYSTSVPYLFLRNSESQVLQRMSSFFRFAAHLYRSVCSPCPVAGNCQKYFRYNWKCRLQ
jgi:hypothetical protein